MMNAYCGEQFLHQIITKLQKRVFREFLTYLKELNMKINNFSSQQGHWENFEKNSESMSYFHHKTVKK